jgi:uncharacterized protein (TIGR00661 family)
MKRVLVAPLDWGLGHATRCIPIINALLQRGCEVIIAGNGRSLELLRLEFPHLSVEMLPGYDPTYPRSGSMVVMMVKQLPKFFRTIHKEHYQVERIVNSRKIDLIISDNRYGCWSATVPAVFITHQSNIMMPKRLGWLTKLVKRENERLIGNFSQCWIPDFPGENSLAGALADVSQFESSRPIRHIGTISRFKQAELPKPKYDLLCIFSGPEPQRTLFEEIVVGQLAGEAWRVAIVRGIPASEQKPTLNVSGEVFQMATTVQLQALIDQSAIVLARSGFSTVMDLASLRKKAIFVPTPGQTEQEYLATRLMKKGIAYSISQAQFNLRSAMLEVQPFKGFEDLPEETTLLDSVLSEILR